MLLVDAVYINESGGKVLLEYLVGSLYEKRLPFFLLLDKRLESGFITEIAPNAFLKIDASERGRKDFYRRLDKSIKVCFCFANVPPPFHNPATTTFIFFHNSLILAPLLDKSSYSLRQKLAFLSRKIYIRWRNRKDYTWIVQTSSMRAKLSKALGVPAGDITIQPFFEDRRPLPVSKEKIMPPVFLYVADGVPQKNHATLLQAWQILAEQAGVAPQLFVTVPERFGTLKKEISRLQEAGIPITDYGRLSRPALEKLYGQCRYLIFPSLAESFGLPLIEAVQAGCDVIAANLPYVYDVIEPTATFDPLDPVDIAKTVQQVMTGVGTKQTKLILKNQVDDLVQLLYKDDHV